MKTELEDLSFKFLYEEAYNDLAKRIDMRSEERDLYTQEIKNIICSEVLEYGLKAEVEGRAKHFYGIYKKMQEQHIEFDEVYDLIAFRIILDTDKDKECYEALSVVHSLWKPVPGRFKDYIAMPKANNYRSLHTTVIGPYGERIEIQIRTKEMHEWSEEGIAAHWRYKEKGTMQGSDELQIKKLRELLDFQHELKDPREFMKNLKLALFPDEVYIFTPAGDVKAFPKGATPIDFAYSIHTDVGNQCIGARINRALVPLKYELQNGDTVEIITQSGHHPSKDWLKSAVTSRAISKIKNWIKTEERKKSIDLGKDILEKEFRKHHLKFSRVVKMDEFKKVYDEYAVTNIEDIMALVGYGKISVKHIVKYFIPEEEKNKEGETILDKLKKRFTKPSTMGVSITGVDDVMVRFSKCCDPLPGDDIIGYITRGRGISVHRLGCAMVQDIDPERLIEVQWNVSDRNTFYQVHVRVVCKDKKGVLAEVSNIISSRDINIGHATIETRPDKSAVCDFQLDVHDLHQLNDLMTALKKLNSVLFVERVRGV
jgi:GTP pyrophosphokinase